MDPSLECFYVLHYFEKILLSSNMLRNSPTDIASALLTIDSRAQQVPDEFVVSETGYMRNNQLTSLRLTYI